MERQSQQEIVPILPRNILKKITLVIDGAFNFSIVLSSLGTVSIDVSVERRVIWKIS
jgi:hypothetical protein